MNFMSITSPFGQTIGYILGNFRPAEEWYLNYCLLGALNLTLSLGIFSPSKYFSAKYNLLGYKEDDSKAFVKETKNWKLTPRFEKEK